MWMNGWPGEYWLEQIKDLPLVEEPNYESLSSKRKELEAIIVEIKKEIASVSSALAKEAKKTGEKKKDIDPKLLRKLDVARYDLFIQVDQPIRLYRAWKWKRDTPLQK